MAGEKILLVEDESIVALDIQERLKGFGYEVIDVVSSAEEALKWLKYAAPDLVLMDIKLAGQMDGIFAADTMRKEFDVPVVFLTAFADDTTLQRAKLAQPYGYLIKPFKERELYSTLELALYKHKEEKNKRDNEERLSGSLKYIGDAVITTDCDNTIIFMNPIAEKFTGWPERLACGRKLQEVLEVGEDVKGTLERSRLSSPDVDQRESDNGHFTILKSRDGTEIPIGISLAPIFKEAGDKVGYVIVFYDFSERKKEEQRYRAFITELKRTIERVKPSEGLIPICASCKKIRDPLGVWIQIEDFLTKQYRTEFSHSVCPDCTGRLYPDLQK